MVIALYMKGEHTVLAVSILCSPTLATNHSNQGRRGWLEAAEANEEQ